MVKSILLAFIFTGFIIVHASNAQTRFSYPMKPGDISVYTYYSGPRGGSQLNLYCRTIRELPIYPGSGNFNHDNDTVLVESGIGDYYSLGINAEGFPDYIGHGYLTSGFIELAPMLIPASDTFFVHAGQDSLLCVITSRFDTTIFNVPTQAIYLKTFTQYDTIIQTIANKFGTVRQSQYYSFGEHHFILNSAEIDGIKYNRDETRRSYMPLCIGNTYQWYIDSFYIKPYYKIETIIDTININNIIYYKTSLSNFYRQDTVGIYRFDTAMLKDILMCPLNATIGSIFPNGVVTDTTSIEQNGRLKRQITIKRSFTGYAYAEKWIEGTGRIELYNFNGTYQQHDELVYAYTCTETYGKLVYVENQKQPLTPLIILSQNIPNPFSASTIINYKLASAFHVRLEVFDLLGRKVATLVDEEKETGEYNSKFDIRYSSAGGGFAIHSGIYFYRLTIGNNVITKKMIVIN